MNTFVRSSARWLCWIHSYARGRLQSFAAVWCFTGPGTHPRAHAHSQCSGRSTCPRGQIFELTLSETSATSLRGCELWLLTRSKLGLAWAMQLYIEDIVIGIKRPGHCMKHDAVCCSLHKSNRVPNVVALTTLPRFLIHSVQREQIFCRTAQMHNVRLVDNSL